MYWKVVRDEQRLRKARQEIKQANQIINTAKKGCEAAAQAVLAGWEGSAADAFAKEQLEYSNWITRMMQIVDEVTNVLEKAEQIYEQAESTVSSMIKNK